MERDCTGGEQRRPLGRGEGGGAFWSVGGDGKTISDTYVSTVLLYGLTTTPDTELPYPETLGTSG